LSRLTLALFGVVLAPLPAIASAEPSSLRIVLLHPGSTIELIRSDGCEVVTNITSDTFVPLLAADKAWAAFTQQTYPPITVKDCANR